MKYKFIIYLLATTTLSTDLQAPRKPDDRKHRKMTNENIQKLVFKDWKDCSKKESSQK